MKKTTLLIIAVFLFASFSPAFAELKTFVNYSITTGDGIRIESVINFHSATQKPPYCYLLPSVSFECIKNLVL
jgi:hypothetical protein